MQLTGVGISYPLFRFTAAPIATKRMIYNHASATSATASLMFFKNFRNQIAMNVCTAINYIKLDICKLLLMKMIEMNSLEY